MALDQPSFAALFALIFEPDPYFALHLDITNKTDEPLRIETFLFSPMVPVLAPFPPVSPFAMFQGQFSFDLFDANGDGSAFYGGGSAKFSLTDRVSGAGFPLTPNFGIETDEAGPNGIPNVGPMPVPPSFTGQWDTMEFFHTGFNFLSPHDRVVLKAFGCVAVPGGDACPPAPDLSPLAIPEPNSVWLFLAGLLGVAGWRSYAVKRSVRPGATDRALEPVRG